MSIQGLTFREALPSDLAVCSTIEAASYPTDEAASPSSLAYRQSHAPSYFRCAVLNEKLIGFCCGTRCQEFTHSSMETHANNGRFLAIHSVVVTEEHRRKGVATALLKDYIRFVQQQQQQQQQDDQLPPPMPPVTRNATEPERDTTTNHFTNKHNKNKYVRPTTLQTDRHTGDDAGKGKKLDFTLQLLRMGFDSSRVEVGRGRSRLFYLYSFVSFILWYLFLFIGCPCTLTHIRIPSHTPPSLLYQFY
jgi:GNAT superfamily N-acetyltransferase